MSIGSDQAVVIWGEVLWDRFPDGDRLGGAPANVAWHLGLAGGWARFVSRVGDDTDGRKALELLGTVSDADLVQIDAERQTGEVLVNFDGSEPRYTLVAGRAWERIECTRDVAAALGEAGVMVYGTLAQHTDTGIAGWRDAIAAAQGKCLKVCDVNLRRLPIASANEQRAVKEAIAAADIIKVNDQELARIAEWFAWRDPVRELRKGRRVLAITHGKDGATLYGDKEIVEVAGVQSKPGGDNVGCGDAFVALFVHGMTLGWDLQTSGNAAARWASAVAGERGATPLFSEERIDELLGEVVT
ncbi:MAG TPA: PfkB family carbohydrate kinase [Kofleriaceae bacterium]